MASWSPTERSFHGRVAVPPLGVTGAIVAAVLGGASLSAQSYVNGRLSIELGSAAFAAAVSGLVALTILIAVAAATGALPRGVGRLRRAEGLRPWHWFSGLSGAALIGVSTRAAPEVGIALLTVAVVCGQTSGGLAADGAGLSPAGRHPPTAGRSVGAALTVTAVAIGALSAPVHLELGLLALVVVAGAGSTIVQAGIGHLRRASGAPLVAATITIGVATVALVVVALATTGGHPPHGWDTAPLHYLGGPLGATVALVMASTVSVIGVLRLSLSLVAGQSACGLAIDLLAPVPGGAVTAGTVAGVALALVAVAVSGRPGGSERRRTRSRRPASRGSGGPEKRPGS